MHEFLSRRMKHCITIDALSEVIHLVESLPRVNRDFACSPEIFKRRFLRRPIPPSFGSARWTRKIARHQWTTMANRVANFFDARIAIAPQLRLKPSTLVESFARSKKSMRPPMAPIRANHACIMRPVFEKRTLLLREAREHRRRVSIESRVQNQMMRTIDAVDAVELEKPEVVHRSFERPCIRVSNRG